MQTVDLPLAVVLWQLKNDLSFAKTVRWPELDGIENSSRQLIENLKIAAPKLVQSGFPKFFSPIRSIDPIRFSFRQLPEAVEYRRITVMLTPPRDNVGWKTPVELPFDVVFWSVQNFRIASVPLLHIEMSLKNTDRLDERLQERIRQVLTIRHGKDFGLEQILFYREFHEADFQRLRLVAELPTFQENVKLEHGNHLRTVDQQRWEKLGVRFFEQRHRPTRAYGFETLLDRLTEEILGDQPRPILLVGPGGVGKTALWNEFVHRARSGEILVNTRNDELDVAFKGFRFGETDATQLVTMTDDDPFADNDWQGRCDRLVKLAAGEHVVLHLGNLWELTQVGMSEGQNRSLGSYLIPVAADRFPFLCECTAEQLAVLEQEQPSLLFPFVKIDVSEPDESASLKIYRAVAETVCPGRFEEAAIRKLDALHRRYAAYSAAPGRPLRFLRNLVGQRLAMEDPDTSITAADVVEAFSRETGLPLILLEDSVPMDVEETLVWFRRKIIGQDDPEGAIPTIVDLLLTYKARLTRPDRPIASLLFVGPTGVGKTETAKALAEFLYGDAGRLIRIDMSEYAEYGAAERLIRGSRLGEGVLTSRIRQQPFSVLLLDEFEKAHEEVYDLLLQVLGEGRLTDAAGRVADFRNCVILMTSNLGVERFGRPKAGFDAPNESDREKAVAHFTSEAARLLRPEMLNRIDRIVPFHSLSLESLRKILDIQMAKMFRRHGLAVRPLSLEIAPEAYDHLVRRGYVPRFGARPLRRVLEQELLLPLAAALRRYTARTALDVSVSLLGDEISVSVTPSSDTNRQEPEYRFATARLQDYTEFRRRTRQLREHPSVEEMRSRAKRAESIRDRMNRKRKKPIPAESLRFLDQVERFDLPRLDRVVRLDERAVHLEERALLDYFAEKSVPVIPYELKMEFETLVFELFEEEHESSDRVLFVTYGKSPEATETLRELYESCALRLGMKVSRYVLEICSKPEHLDEVGADDEILLSVKDSFGRKKRPTSSDWESLQKQGIQTVHARRLEPGAPKILSGRSQPAQVLEIRGSRSGHLFAGEFGRHRLLNVGPQNKAFECSVEISMKPLQDFFPQIDSRGNVRISDPVMRRTFDCDPGGPHKGKEDVIRGVDALRAILEKRLEAAIADWLDR